jgi:hypothetical protein
MPARSSPDPGGITNPAVGGEVPAAIVGASKVGATVFPLGEPFPLSGRPLPLLGIPLSLVGGPLYLSGGPLPQAGKPLPQLGGPLSQPGGGVYLSGGLIFLSFVSVGRGGRGAGRGARRFARAFFLPRIEPEKVARQAREVPGDSRAAFASLAGGRSAPQSGSPGGSPGGRARCHAIRRGIGREPRGEVREERGARRFSGAPQLVQDLPQSPGQPSPHGQASLRSIRRPEEVGGEGAVLH